MKRVLFVIVCFLLTKNLSAVTHYVSKTGSNIPPYTSWATAADSIQKAIDVSVSGDTVRVGPGVYAESLILGNGVYLIGSGIDSTTIDGRGIAQYIIQTSDTNWIEGFWIRGNGTGSDGILFNRLNADDLLVVENNRITEADFGIYGARGNLVVRNNIFEGNGDGIRTGFYCKPTIENNIFRGFVTNFSAYGIFCDFSYATINNNLVDSFIVLGSGIYGLYNYRLTVSNNLVAGVEHSSSDGIQVVTQPNQVTKVMNNTITGVDFNNRWGLRVAGNSNPSDSTRIIINNIVTGFKYGFSYGGNSWDNPEVSYNDFWNNMINDTTESGSVGSPDSGNISLDPMFVDDISDFHLQYASPCIDAGALWIKDPDSSRSDMGAYGGLLGEIYVYQDLAPDVPESLQASSESTYIVLTWKPNTESDLGGYVVYKDSFPGFPADSFSAIAVLPKDSSLYRDPNWTLNQTYYYRVAAFDTLNHLSAGSPEVMVLATDVKQIEEPKAGHLPTDYTLYQNYPNPFNPTTTIVYFLPNVGPQPASVELKVYDVLGRLVKTLVEKKQNPGFYQVTWDGKNADGEKVSTGVYFCSMRIWGHQLSKPAKLVLLR